MNNHFRSVVFLVTLVSGISNADELYLYSTAASDSCDFVLQLDENGEITSLKGNTELNISKFNAYGECTGLICKSKRPFNSKTIEETDLSDPLSFADYRFHTKWASENAFTIRGSYPYSLGTSEITIRYLNGKLTYVEKIKTGYLLNWLTIARAKAVCNDVTYVIRRKGDDQ